MKFFIRAPRVLNIKEYDRLPVVRGELPLREKLPQEKHLEDIREAQEYLFQNTPQISRLPKQDSE
jgi:hypothetical protein